MSHDIEIGTAEPPPHEAIDTWARQNEQRLDDGWVGNLFRISGPAPADEFAPEIAAACEAPRWRTSLSVPFTAPDEAVDLARELARFMAMAHEGAAFDLQERELLWPLNRDPAPPPPPEELTSLVELDWLVVAERWERAPSALVDAIGRHLPEALPLRYGHYWPYDKAFEPETFVRFILAEDREYDSGFWKARWPSFGGHWFYEPEFGVGTMQLSFDLRGLDVERVVALFTAAAQDLGAFFAAAQVNPGYEVVEGEPSMTRLTTGTETFVTSILGWRGLPPVPMWLSWFGEPYRELVAEHLLGANDDRRGLFVRMSDEPRPAAELGDWPLPPELTYRYRPAYTRTPDGWTRSNPPEGGDEAETIPPV